MAREIRGEAQVQYKAILVGGSSDGRTFSISKRLGIIMAPNPSNYGYPEYAAIPEFMPLPSISRYTLQTVGPWPSDSNVLIYVFESEIQRNAER